MTDVLVAVFLEGWHTDDRWMVICANEVEAIRAAARINGGGCGLVQGFQYSDGRLRGQEELVDEIWTEIQRRDDEPGVEPVGYVVNPFDGSSVRVYTDPPPWVGRRP